jgi:hypothetical protein
VALTRSAKRVIHEEKVVKAVVPPGLRFKEYGSFVVQDLVLRPHIVRCRRERWLTPDGRTVIAPGRADEKDTAGRLKWPPEPGQLRRCRLA